MTQHGDRIMWWIADGGLLVLLAGVGVFAALVAVERWRDRQREAEADAILLPAASSVDERTVEEIAADGLTDEQRADAERDARIALWENDPSYFRRRDLATMDQFTKPLAEICDRYRRDLLSAYEDGALAAEGFGFQVQRDRARMAALYDRAHDADELREMAARPLAVKVDATDTCEWPQEWEDELDALLSEAVTA